jgi:hypothetical protein
MTSLTEGFLQLGMKQAALFKNEPDLYLNCLVKYSGQRVILYSTYRMLVSSGRIKRIEDLPIDFKREIFEEAKRVANGRLPTDKLVMLSCILYCLEFLLSNQ